MATQPKLTLPQFVKYREAFIEPQVRAYRAVPWTKVLWKRFWMYFHPTLVSPYLFPLVPVGVLGLTTAGRWAVVATIPLSMLAY